MSASYCFLNCSILGNTSFSSRIHLNCVITTIPHLKMGRRPPKVYCCSKMKGRKGQVYSSNSTTIFKVFSCLTINITPETNNEHSDKTLEVSVSTEEKLYSVVSKSVARRRSKIKIIVKILQGHCIRLTHHKGLIKENNLPMIPGLNRPRYCLPH